MSAAIDRLLASLDIHPILVDIGASGEPPRIWAPLIRRSVYVGFDPDLRETHELSSGSVYRGVILNQAVTSEPTDGNVEFYLTRFPFCSSTLEPDSQSLSNYVFADLFTVEKRVSVKATRLDNVLERLALAGIDWLKIDSQGTDLRLFNSLGAETRSRVLALDIEPGLIDAYRGEDLFIDAHRELTHNGFWLSNLQVQGTVRMRRATLEQMLATENDLSRDRVEKSVRVSPGWVEARYLRTLEWVLHHNLTKREYALLWSFALLDGQVAFAFDLAVEWERIFGPSDLSNLMKAEALSRIRRSPRYPIARARSFAPGRLKRWLRQLVRMG